MIRKVALAIGVLTLVMAAIWLVIPPRAAARNIKMESRPRVTFEANRLRLEFKGLETRDLHHRLRQLLGSADNDDRYLWVEVALRGPPEPRRYLIAGESRLQRGKATFLPAASNDPEIENAMMTINIDDQTEFVGNHAAQMTGALTIERVKDGELKGSLELNTPDLGVGGGFARVSSPFSVVMER